MRNWSISTLLTILVFGVTVVGVVGIFSVLLNQRFAEIEEELLTTSETIAGTIAQYTKSSLAFADQTDAEEALAQLSTVTNVEAARLYDSEGKIFASFHRDAQADLGLMELRSDHYGEIRSGHVLVQRPVALRDTVYGSIVLQSSAATLVEKRRGFLISLGELFALMVLLSASVAFIVHRIVTRPLQEVSALASRVAEGAQPPAGVRRRGVGEIGQLSLSLDAMFKELNHRADALAESTTTVQALIEASPLAIVGSGPDGDVVLWSQEAERIFGLSASDALGCRAETLLRNTDVGAIWKRCLSGTAVPAAECQWQGPKGEERILQISAACFDVPHRENNGTVLVVSDVTSRTQAQADLAERAKQVQVLQKQEAVGRLAAGVAHDFNNILMVIMASASMSESMAKKEGREKLQTLATNTITATERGAALTKRLLAFSKPSQPLVKEMNICDALRDFEPILRSVVEESLILHFEIPNQQISAIADQGQLEQVLLNLVINAKQATPAGGQLTLSVCVEEGVVKIRCHDSGDGMEPEVAARIFEPFYTTKATGTGLGLSTSRQILQGWGGNLEVSSRTGVGTTMTISLPHQESTKAIGIRTVLTGSQEHSETVLLVDDQDMVREAVRIMLEHLGYNVLVCVTPEAALAKARDLSVSIDILLSDVVMPYMSGPELAQRILKIRPGLPVLFMSGYIGDELAIHGLASETGQLVRKPFGPTEIANRIESLCAKHESPETGTTSVGCEGARVL